MANSSAYEAGYGAGRNRASVMSNPYNDHVLYKEWLQGYDDGKESLLHPSERNQNSTPFQNGRAKAQAALGMRVENSSKEMREGKEAYLKGKDIKDNPYGFMGKASENWDKGWESEHKKKMSKQTDSYRKVDFK